MSRAILDAARDLFVAEGYQNVSIRKIAERIEYSPAAIYGYFPSKDDIFFALAEEGFHLLASGPAIACDVEACAPGDLIEAVRRAFWRVYEFSKSHPEYYDLMFVDRSVPRISQNWGRFGFVRDMRSRVRDVIQAAIDAGAFAASTNPDAAFRILITAVHGAAVGRLCSRLAPGEDADALARDTLEAVLTGLRAGFPATFHPVSWTDPSAVSK